MKLFLSAKDAKDAKDAKWQRPSTFLIVGISSLSFAFFASFADKITGPAWPRRTGWPNGVCHPGANHHAGLWQNQRLDRKSDHA